MENKERFYCAFVQPLCKLKVLDAEKLKRAKIWITQVKKKLTSYEEKHGNFREFDRLNPKQIKKSIGIIRENQPLELSYGHIVPEFGIGVIQ